MPIKSPAPAKFAERIERVINARMRAIVATFEYVGLECLTEMRENRRYTDRTGNLRSSTGFAVVVNGKVVKKSAFESVGSGNEGSSNGKELVAQVSNELPSNSIALVLVAGMKYAVYVEAMGLNVTDSAANKAKTMVDRLLREIGLKK